MKHVTSYIFLIITLLLLGVNEAAAQEKDCPFKVTVDGNNNTISYANKVLSIASSDKVTITGDGNPTDWGIEIESLSGSLLVTIKDLNIEREGVPLKKKASEVCTIIIEGTNRFVSTGSSGTAGIEVERSLFLQGSGSLTAIGAKGAGNTPGGAGIGGGSGSSLTIQGGIIHAEGGAGAPGIGVSDPQKEGMTIQIVGGTVTAIGGGGANPAPGIDGGTSFNYPSIELNAFVIAIDGTDAKGENPATTNIKNHKNGLFILGQQQPGGSIVWASSDLKGNNFTLGGDAEIPAWATVTIADGQTFTIPDGITLTNNGTLVNEGTLTNNGTFTNNGTVESNTFLNIGGEGGFDVTKTSGSVTFSYDDTKKLLTISGIGSVFIKGRNKNNAVECGIVIAQGAAPDLTIEDLNIEADDPLVFEDGETPHLHPITLQGTNRLTSTRGPGLNLGWHYANILGTGSLTVTGGNGAAGIDGDGFHISENAFVVAIGGEGATSGISGINVNDITHNSGLFIYGTQQSDGSISQEYSELKGDNFTLGGDAEIPKGATVTITAGQTFTIAPNVTLTNIGIINNEGTIYNNGTIYNKGTLTGNPVGGKLPHHYITFDANYPSLSAVERYILQGEAFPSDIFTRSGYTFQGWYDAPDGGTKVETSAKPQTLYARWEAVPVPEPEPTPVYYTVTLPEVEGVVTDPVAGTYEVEAWDTFRFYLTLDTAYSESQPVITTSRSETIKLRISDGAYLVKYVRSDVEIYIDGIEKNNPVANDPIRTENPVPEIWSENGCLCIRLPEGMPSAPVHIFTPEGRLLQAFRSTPGLNRRQLPTGLYIVQVGDTVRKVIIR